TLLLDVEQLVEGPDWAFVILDRQRAEWNVIAAMRVIHRAAWFPVHARYFAILRFVVCDDPLEVADEQFLAGLLQHYGAELIKNLALIEAIFAVTARRCYRILKIVKDYIFLTDLLVPGSGALRLAHD